MCLLHPCATLLYAYTVRIATENDDMRHIYNSNATLEAALEAQVRLSTCKKWLKENEKAIASLNELVENNGLFSDSYRVL